MDTVIVQLPERAGHRPGGAASKPELLRMGPGESAEFGRGSPGRPAAVPLDDQGVSRRAGEITAAEDYWRLSNFSAGATYVVENLEGAGEHVKVAPGRLGAPVPFEFSRVVLPSLGGSTHFKVFAPQHAYLDGGSGPSTGEHTVSPFALDPTSKYFLVLLALCEPRLRSARATVPGATEVVERLRPLPGCRELSRSAVNYHIDYLAGVKLRLREDPPPAGPGLPGAAARTGPAGGKREELVSLALRFDLVREDHLALLPVRRTR
ncbi:serine/threonine protein kinase [Streptomyces sp. CB03911]|uniref:serine/threonine protein kinase n=1 Tax=Streptomyces sp. CB03911 TaxID=1804758 RepID=UPI00093DB619|nr:serine/threonine protein kinase [Streptomyces sp. CB03911]OKI30757.1 serine/threonine protein kinase [Streptomyces sp. CB03911]